MFEHSIELKTNIATITDNFSYDDMVIDWYAPINSLVTIGDMSTSLGIKSVCSIISDLMQQHKIHASVAALGAAVNIDDIIKNYRESKNPIFGIVFSKNSINVVFSDSEVMTIL